MKDKTKKIFKILGYTAAALTSVAGVVGAAYAGAKCLVEEAVNKEEPMVMKGYKSRMAARYFGQEVLDVLAEAEKELINIPTETVEITAYDGIKLVGHLYRCENADRTIIAMHGWRSRWSRDFSLVSKFLIESDCNILFVSQRGQNESESEYMGFGMLERYDCLEWIKFINQKISPNLPIYLYGISMGATSVLMTTGFELPSNVRGVIADCGFTCAKDIWKKVTEGNFHITYELFDSLGNEFLKQKINMSNDEYSTVTAMKQCKIPVLFIHGADDHLVPISMTYENYRACIAPKRLLVVPYADHGMSYYVDKTAYETALKNFFTDYDK